MTAPDLPGPSALFISGTVGAGKTSTAEAVGAWLAEQAVPGAIIDPDRLRRCWPSPPGDRFNSAVEIENLTAVAATSLRAGARRLVLPLSVQPGGTRTRGVNPQTERARPPAPPEPGSGRRGPGDPPW